MICQSCQREIEASPCPYCATAATATPGQAAPGDAFAASGVPQALSPAKKLWFSILAAMFFLIVFAIAVVRTNAWGRPEPSAEKAGYLIGSCITPLLIGYLLARLINKIRVTKMANTQLALCTAGIAVLLSLLAVAGDANLTRPRSHADTKTEMAHLIRQATGEEAVTPDSEWWEGSTRECLRDIMNKNKEYTAAIHSLQDPSLPKLYAVDSYASRPEMRRHIVHLQSLLDVDKKYDSIEPIVKQFERNIALTSVSDREKKEFIEGFHKTFDPRQNPRIDTFRTEEAWLQSCIDLYDFTVTHFADYRIRDNKLYFHVEASRLAFQDLQSKSITLHKSALEAKKKLEAAQADAMSNTGMSPADISSAPSK
jgi:hypothetical protein